MRRSRGFIEGIGTAAERVGTHCGEVSHARRTACGAALVALLIPATAAAEVLDKVTQRPWDTGPIAMTAILTALCAAMAWSPWPRLRALAVGLAVAWAALRIGTDEWFSADLGPALRAELPAGPVSAWWPRTVALQAAVPLLVSIALSIVRARRASSSRPSG